MREWNSGAGASIRNVIELFLAREREKGEGGKTRWHQVCHAREPFNNSLSIAFSYPFLSQLSPSFFPTVHVQAVFRLSQPLSARHVPKTGFPSTSPHSLALTVFLHPLLQCSFHLRGGVLDVPIRAGHSTVTYS